MYWTLLFVFTFSGQRNGLSDMSSSGLEKTAGLGSARARLHHDQRNRKVIIGGLQIFLRHCPISAREMLQNSNRPLTELRIFWKNVDHQIAIDVSQAGHGAAGEHVEHHFLRGTSLHAARSRDHFGTDFGDDGEAGGLLQRRIAVTGDRDSLRSVTAGVSDGGDGKRSASAGGDSDDNIILARFSFCDRALTELAGVFIGFDGGGEGLVTASDYELHHPRIGVEGWRTFGSIERGDAAASAGADVDQAASFF